MKKIMTSILLVFLTFYLAACSGNSPMPLPSGGETTVSVRYMPDITELSAIYENCRDINAALRKIHGFDDKAAMNGLETNWYWASTQSDNDDDYAWFIHFLNGYSCDCPKNFTNLHVLAVRIL